MRATKVLVLCALVPVLVGACNSDNVNQASSSPQAQPRSTTTTTSPVDRGAVDALIDRIVPAYKPVLKAESGEVPARQLGQAATDLSSLAVELKDPAKRPRGVPANVVDELVGALATAGTAASDLANNLGSCPAGISTPRCTELYLRVNQAQTALNSALLAFADFGTRPRDGVQNLLYS